MKITACRFVASAFRPDDEPKTADIDVVFFGRSNVGKSSLINRLVGKSDLARTSSQPGRTQSVNFYRINESFHFVDLPGYGYARVPLAVRDGWRPLIEGYLQRRGGIIGLAILVVDARHDPTDKDETMREWLDDTGIPYVVVATKIDKLSRQAVQQLPRRLAAGIGNSKDCRGTAAVSSETGAGIRTLWTFLDEVLVNPVDRHGRG